MKGYARIGVLALLLISPGCFGPGPFGDVRYSYKVCGVVVTDVPDDATVIEASDRRIQDVESIQRAMEQAIDDDSETEMGPMRCVSVTESEYATAEQQLRRTPLYHGDPHGNWGSNTTGLYIAKNDSVVRIEITKAKLG